ncbi:DUF3592 domain-containing protein, partial [Halorubrum sp. CBA1125]|uniref:DUF3592 domain-containing protein n=1 Tax=Halorubrum sp. CBA1125 TaxID=2668072 RepID=UPI0012E8269C|nr:DUF3592 domain-containing protein [Halorubrum sp. CBA1125]
VVVADEREVIEGYAVDETVTAYVDPSNPGTAFLKHQRSNAPLVAVAIGLFFVLAGGASAVKQFRR